MELVALEFIMALQLPLTLAIQTSWDHRGVQITEMVIGTIENVLSCTCEGVWLSNSLFLHMLLLNIGSSES